MMRTRATFSVLTIFFLAIVATSTTTLAIDYGTDVSYPMHYANFTLLEAERDLLGTDKQRMYQEHLKGCADYYDQILQAGGDGATTNDTGHGRCNQVESDRIAMNLRQPQSMINYTQNGYVKIRAPEAVWKLVQEFWRLNRHNTVEEQWFTGSTYVNHWNARVELVSVENQTLVGGGTILKNAIWHAARDTLQEWTGQILADCSLYGIRIYHEGSILAPHVDRLPLVASAILNVDQDVDEPWPLEVIGHDQRAVNVTMEPGDLVLYESHSIIHGRPFPLKGRFMANIFIHFEPVAPLSEPNPIFRGDLPPYIIPGSPEVPVWQGQNPQGWQAIQTRALTVGTTEAHQIVIEQALDHLNYILDLHPHYVHQADEQGWTPLHEAMRTLRLDLTQCLVERGADIHRKTRDGESPLFLALYFVETAAPEEEYRTHPYSHPMVQYLRGLGARVERDGYNVGGGDGEL